LAITLERASDEDFGWLLGGPATHDDLTLPDGGIDHPDVLRLVRAVAERVRAAHGGGTWLIVCEREIVGLCSYMNAPDSAGEVEIGFGIAASCRQRGHATAAVAALIELSRNDIAVRTLLAGTAVWNRASQQVLERNGFHRVGAKTDPEDGDVILWRRDI